MNIIDQNTRRPLRAIDRDYNPANDMRPGILVSYLEYTLARSLTAALDAIDELHDRLDHLERNQCQNQQHPNANGQPVSRPPSAGNGRQNRGNPA